MRKILVAACLVFSASAWAEGIEFWALGGETLVSSPGLGADPNLCVPPITNPECQSIGGTSSDWALTDGWHFGFRGGFNAGDHMGYEIGYMYNRTNLKLNDYGGAEEGMAYHQVYFNALYHFTAADSKIRPFVTGGVGFTNYAPPGSSAAYGGGSTKLGVDYGAGLKIKLTDRYGIRFDIRQAATPKPLGLVLASGWLLATEVSAGFGIFF